MPKEPLEYVKHIRDECSYILSVINSELSKDDCLQNETLKRAIVRSLEIIGEASEKFLQILKLNGIKSHGEILLK